MPDLLIELGTEELPEDFILNALEELSSAITDTLSEAQISYKRVKTFSTPRRLCVCISEVDSLGELRALDFHGPSKSEAYDKNSSPTPAAIGFAKKHNILVDELEIKSLDKGEYVVYSRPAQSVNTQDILISSWENIKNSIIGAKEMKWSADCEMFVRPIRWLVALFGEAILPVFWSCVPAQRCTYGHSFLAPNAIELKNASQKNYIDELRKAYVIADIDERKTILLEKISSLIESKGGEGVDDVLLSCVANQLEWPNAVYGSFSESFLELPNDMVSRVLLEKVHVFPVIGSNSQLRSYFVAAVNRADDSLPILRKGIERAVRYRLSDVRFFWLSAKDRTRDSYLDALRDVAFLGKLGSYSDKGVRTKMLVRYIADEVNSSIQVKEAAETASLLAKSDVTSRLVAEFPSLHGVIAENLAQSWGEADAVVCAIREHVKPSNVTGALPDSEEGRLLSLSDRIDTIVGHIGSKGAVSSRNAPSFVRRDTIIVLRVLLDSEMSFNLTDLFSKAYDIYAGRLDLEKEETLNEVVKLYEDRFIRLLSDYGYSRDIVLAVKQVHGQNPLIWRRCVDALTSLNSDDTLTRVGAILERLNGIINAAESEIVEINEALFESEIEKAFYSALNEAKKVIHLHLEELEFKEAVESYLSILEAPMLAYIEEVPALVDDPAIQLNRISMITEALRLFITNIAVLQRK